MACFIVPGTEAVITTVVTKVVDAKASHLEDVASKKERSPFVKKLPMLNNMLWGGSALLLFEHIWHGEITPFFPFITAMNSPADTAEMLAEMSTVGVAMAAAVTAVWGGIVAVSNAIEKRNDYREDRV